MLGILMGFERELERCYAIASRMIGGGAEALRVVQTAEEHRNFWRPSKVQVLLLGESHVHTKTDECAPMPGAARFGPEGVPNNFVRLVYCLGYGEPDYAGTSLQSNSGTWQYWRIFSSCVFPHHSPEFTRVQKRCSPSVEERIKAKASLLKRLKEAGVWLLDTSILALYNPGGGKPIPAVREKILRACWDQYVGHVVSAARPGKIVVIGQGVARALAGRLDDVSKGNHEIISQPQGLRNKEAIVAAHQSYFAACNSSCSNDAQPSA